MSTRAGRGADGGSRTRTRRRTAGDSRDRCTRFGDDRRGRRRRERRLEDAVEIEVVEVAEADRLRAGALRAGAARRLRVDARRLVAAHVGSADRVALIRRHHVVHAEPRPDLPAVLQFHVEQIVVPRHVIDAHARVDRQALHRPPRVLEVERVVGERAGGEQARARVVDAAAERDGARRRDCSHRAAR